MIVNLPKIVRTFDSNTQQVITQKEELPVIINTNFQAHLKWEEEFQEKEGKDLTQVTLEVKEIVKDTNHAARHITKLLKVLFCFIDSSELPNFKDFLGLLELENTKDIIDILTKVLDQVHKTASKN